MMLEWCTVNKRFERYAALFLMAYAFLLRLPSEALPAASGRVCGQSSLYREGETIVLVLSRRCGLPLWNSA